MCSASYCLIRMAIEMAHKAGPFFSVADFMSCTTIATNDHDGRLAITWSFSYGYTSRIAPADAMVIDFSIKNRVVALWKSLFAASFKKQHTT